MANSALNWVKITLRAQKLKMSLNTSSQKSQVFAQKFCSSWNHKNIFNVFGKQPSRKCLIKLKKSRLCLQPFEVASALWCVQLCLFLCPFLWLRIPQNTFWLRQISAIIASSLRTGVGGGHLLSLSRLSKQTKVKLDRKASGTVGWMPVFWSQKLEVNWKWQKKRKTIFWAKIYIRSEPSKIFSEFFLPLCTGSSRKRFLGNDETVWVFPKKCLNLLFSKFCFFFHFWGFSCIFFQRSCFLLLALSSVNIWETSLRENDANVDAQWSH